MLKLDVFEVVGDLEHRLHVAEGGAKNQRVALGSHVANHALGVGRLRYFFDKAGDDLVAKLFFDFFASVVVRVAPAAITDRANISKSDFHRLNLGRRSGGGLWRRRRCRFFLFATASQGRRRYGGQGHHLEQGSFLQVSHVISLSFKGSRKSKPRHGGENHAIMDEAEDSAPRVKGLAN